MQGNFLIRADLPERSISVPDCSVPAMINNIYRSAVPAQKYLPAPLVTNHYTPVPNAWQGIAVFTSELDVLISVFLSVNCETSSFYISCL